MRWWIHRETYMFTFLSPQPAASLRWNGLWLKSLSHQLLRYYLSPWQPAAPITTTKGRFVQLMVHAHTLTHTRTHTHKTSKNAKSTFDPDQSIPVRAPSGWNTCTLTHSVQAHVSFTIFMFVCRSVWLRGLNTNLCVRVRVCGVRVRYFPCWHDLKYSREEEMLQLDSKMGGLSKTHADFTYFRAHLAWIVSSLFFCTQTCL